MIRFLLNAGIQLVTAVIALLVAGALVPGFRLEPAGFIVAAAVLTLSQAILGPFVFNVARKYASAILGGIGLVSALLSVWIASLFPGGIHLDGALAWAVSPLVIWVVTTLGGWILGYLILRRWWDRRGAPGAQAKA